MGIALVSQTNGGGGARSALWRVLVLATATGLAVAAPIVISRALDEPGTSAGLTTQGAIDPAAAGAPVPTSAVPMDPAVPDPRPTLADASGAGASGAAPSDPVPVPAGSTAVGPGASSGPSPAPSGTTALPAAGVDPAPAKVVEANDPDPAAAVVGSEVAAPVTTVPTAVPTLLPTVAPTAVTAPTAVPPPAAPITDVGAAPAAPVAGSVSAGRTFYLPAVAAANARTGGAANPGRGVAKGVDPVAASSGDVAEHHLVFEGGELTVRISVGGVELVEVRQHQGFGIEVRQRTPVAVVVRFSAVSATEEVTMSFGADGSTTVTVTTSKAASPRRPSGPPSPSAS